MKTCFMSKIAGKRFELPISHSKIIHANGASNPLGDGHLIVVAFVLT